MCVSSTRSGRLQKPLNERLSRGKVFKQSAVFKDNSQIPVGLSPLPTGLKCQVGADGMSSIPDEHGYLMCAVALRCLCNDGCLCAHSLPVHRIGNLRQ